MYNSWRIGNIGCSARKTLDRMLTFVPKGKAAYRGFLPRAEWTSFSLQKQEVCILFHQKIAQRKGVRSRQIVQWKGVSQQKVLKLAPHTHLITLQRWKSIFNSVACSFKPVKTTDNGVEDKILCKQNKAQVSLCRYLAFNR